MTQEDVPQGVRGDDPLLDIARAGFLGDLPQNLGVAVSGGSDSLALLHLFASLQAKRTGTLHAVTVDHRLRPEAAEEARFVASVCRDLGVDHKTLVWDHGVITGNLQDQARQARYRLIGDWARRAGVMDILIGHTADDQAETFLMGLARTAGIDGLAGMRARWSEGGIHWSRPLLDVPRADLRAYLSRQGQRWIDDPSNANDRFTRVRARQVLQALEPLGIGVGQLTGVVSNLASVLRSVQIATSDAARAIATEAAGELTLDRRGFLSLPDEIGRRLLSAALRWVSGEAYAPRQTSLTRVGAAIADGRDCTLSGCRVRTTKGVICITREPKAVAGLESTTDALWDNRWRLHGPHHPSLRVRALGVEGLALCENWKETGLSRSALLVSPAIWRGQVLISAPLAGIGTDWVAEIVAGFHSFCLSH